MTADQLRECPFCGGKSVGVREGTTFRWRVAFCKECDATCGEIRHDTMADDQESAEVESHDRAIEEWNTRPTAIASHAEGEVVAYLNTRYKTLFHAGEIGCTDRNHELLATGELVRLYTHPPRSGDEASDARYMTIKRPRFWTAGESNAWHRAIPNVIEAFDELEKASKAAMAQRREDV